MALPTLQPYYMTRRNKATAERLIVQRRTHEDDTKQRWSEHSQYFRNSDVRSSKQEAWTSTKSFQDSMDAYHSKGKMEDKQKSLRERREKLKTLLENEKALLETELKELSTNSLSYMRNRADKLKTSRENERKKIAEEKLQEHWRDTCPQLRETRSRQMQRKTQDEWENQIDWKQKQLESAREEEMRYELQREQERLAALKLDQEEEQRKKEEQHQHSMALQLQMAEIRQSEEEAALLEQQQSRLFQEQAELEAVEEQRRKLEKAQRQAELGRVLVRQHKAQMRRKCQQIQESLELDLKILEDMAAKESEREGLNVARRERAKADVEWMRQVVVDQLRLEKEREAELDHLYQEEAARMWQRREAEWEREKLARERLMAEVLADRQQQIVMKLEDIKTQQEVSIQHREELLKEMELASQLTARETRHKEHEKTRRAEELHGQVSERKRREELAWLQREQELNEQRFAEEEHEAMVRAEEDRIMTSRHYHPQSHGRKKFAWY